MNAQNNPGKPPALPGEWAESPQYASAPAQLEG